MMIDGQLVRDIIFVPPGLFPSLPCLTAITTHTLGLAPIDQERITILRGNHESRCLILLGWRDLLGHLEQPEEPPDW